MGLVSSPTTVTCWLRMYLLTVGKTVYPALADYFNVDIMMSSLCVAPPPCIIISSSRITITITIIIIIIIIPIILLITIIARQPRTREGPSRRLERHKSTSKEKETLQSTGPINIYKRLFRSYRNDHDSVEFLMLALPLSTQSKTSCQNNIEYRQISCNHLPIFL